VIAQELLAGRRDQLSTAIRASVNSGVDGPTVHHQAFGARVLGVGTIERLTDNQPYTFMRDPSEVRYAGYPRVACVGYGLGAQCLDIHSAGEVFLSGLHRLQQRSGSGINGFAEDDVALLGVADGLARLHAVDDDAFNELDALRSWLMEIIRTTAVREHWSRQMRALASDLLDSRGRMRVDPDTEDTDRLALALTLRQVWPLPFAASPTFTADARDHLVRSLLLDAYPSVGDTPKAIVWLRALDTLVDAAAGSLVPSVSDTARILRNVQHALKRWRWKERSSRQGAMPTRWLIDDEYDVQALLWAILYPIYQSVLVDETYLRNWGNVQPRVDLGITTLKLIIEVKIARQAHDFADFEEQIAGDLGLYFKDTSQFDRMIVFVYDDCDKAYPERYQSLANALMQRERIEDVIIVRRPSMIPNRGQRRTADITSSGAE